MLIAGQAIVEQCAQPAHQLAVWGRIWVTAINAQFKTILVQSLLLISLCGLVLRHVLTDMYSLLHGTAASVAFFSRLFPTLSSPARAYGDVYPELVSARDKIHDVIADEEASFSRTLVKGIERFKKLAASAQVGGGL